MIRLSIANVGILCALAACSSGGGTDGTGGTGGKAPGTGGGTTGGTGGMTQGTGGSTGGTGVGTTGGSGGSASPTGGSSGSTTTGGTGGTTAAGGTGMAGTGVATGGTGGTVGGSAGGPPTAGMGPLGGTGGMGTGGSAGTGVSPGGSGPGGSAGTGSTVGPVTVNLASVEQTIEGFGINDTWATAMSDSDADAMFNADKGMGLTILRVGMNDQGGVMSDNITADIPKAKSHGATKIIGSCWSPPSTCKDNNSVNDGGHVKSSCYGSWSDTITSFAKSNGLYAMSIANEPDFASCGKTEPCNGNYPTTLYTADEYVAFLKVAGPKLQAAGIKVIGPEASEWIHNWSNTSASGSEPSNKNSSDPLKCGFPATMCAAGKGYDYGHAMFADKTAWAAFDIMGVHEYDTQHAEPWPADVTEKKPTWQTEMSGVKWWPEQGPSTDIKNGVAVAGWVHSALTVGNASAWLWWWWKAYDTDDNEGLYLKNGTDTMRHYTIANYSKFVRPGYTRVDITGAAPAGVLLSAYKGTDGTVVVVAINNGSAAASVPITISGGTAPAMLTPWVTSATDKLVSKAAVAVSGGTFTAALDTMTVTTFVGK